MSAKNLPGSPITVLASAARTATATSDTYRIPGGQYRGLLIVLNITAVTSTPALTLALHSQTGQGSDFSSQIAMAAKTEADVNTTTLLLAHPDAPDRANVSENTQIGRKWRIVVTHGDSDSATYSVLAYPIV